MSGNGVGFVWYGRGGWGRNGFVWGSGCREGNERGRWGWGEVEAVVGSVGGNRRPPRRSDEFACLANCGEHLAHIADGEFEPGATKHLLIFSQDFLGNEHLNQAVGGKVEDCGRKTLINKGGRD